MAVDLHVSENLHVSQRESAIHRNYVATFLKFQVVFFFKKLATQEKVNCLSF